MLVFGLPVQSGSSIKNEGVKTMTTAERQVDALRYFKVVNEKQRRQSSADIRKHIKDMVTTYNASKLPDEPLMTICEMRAELSRKVDVA